MNVTAAPLIGQPVHGDATDPSGGIVVVTNPPPVPRGLNERILHRVKSRLSIPGDRSRDPLQLRQPRAIDTLDLLKPRTRVSAHHLNA